MIGVVLVIIMMTVTSSAPCEERRLATQLNSNTDDRLFVILMIMIRKIICDNAKHHSAPCEERRRAKQWNYHIHDIDNDNDKKDDM